MQQNCEVLVLGVREPHQAGGQRSGAPWLKAARRRAGSRARVPAPCPPAVSPAPCLLETDGPFKGSASRCLRVSVSSHISIS